MGSNEVRRFRRGAAGTAHGTCRAVSMWSVVTGSREKIRGKYGSGEDVPVVSMGQGNWVQEQESDQGKVCSMGKQYLVSEKRDH